MTDEEKLSTLTQAALYQQQYDVLLRAQLAAKAQASTYESQMSAKKKQLDELWESFRIQIGGGA